MNLASRIFDVVTAPENIYDNSVREIIPDAEARSYWRSVLRMAALCHDVGHLPFSHAAEKELLPEDYDHERLTALGLEAGGLESSEGLMIARHFMYKQVYLHHIRRVYDLHLKDFLMSWLDGGRFSVDLSRHLNITDAEVLAALRAAFKDQSSALHVLARRILCREHFRRFYEAAPHDKKGGKLQPGKIIAQAAEKKFGSELIRYDYIPPKTAAPIFPVRKFDGTIDSSLLSSQVLANLPVIGVDNVYCDKSIQAEAISWSKTNKGSLLNL